MKKQLNEQINRIKDIMSKIVNEQKFKDWPDDAADKLFRAMFDDDDDDDDDYGNDDDSDKFLLMFRTTYGKCSEISIYDENNEDMTDEIDYSDVDEYVKKLESSIEEFKISPYQTYAEVEGRNGMMSIIGKHTNSPKKGDSNEFKFEGLPIIRLR